MIEFKSNGHLTLGVEIEVQLLDPETLDLTPVATDLFALTAGNDHIKPEIFQSMAEINTGICRDAHAAETDLQDSSRVLRQAAQTLGIRVASTGTHPFARYADRKIFSAGRYEKLIDRNQWIARRLMIFGLHVHIGMKDGDTAIRFNNFFLHFVPHLLALTSSSPYWQGEDTGLASSRATIFESCPTAGHPCRVKNWEQFSDLCKNLIHSKAIGSHKDLWWDIRPSPDFGTIEIRVCDGLATIGEAVEIVAFIHALAHWYEEHAEYDSEHRAPYMWMMRENKWRAARHGLDAALIADDAAPLVPLREDVLDWLERLAPVTKKLGYEGYMQGIRQTLARGTSAMRQRAVFEKNGLLTDVTSHNATEFETGARIYL